jgi:hypothetical protein
MKDGVKAYITGTINVTSELANNFFPSAHP